MEVWNNINLDVVRNLYSSYENRLVKVIKNHGSLTGYWFVVCFNCCFKFYSVLYFFTKMLVYVAFWYHGVCPTRPCSLNLSYFRHTVLGYISKDISNISPIRPCWSNLSNLNRIVLYCILNDRSNRSPIRLCHWIFSPIVWYCKLRDISMWSRNNFVLVQSTIDIFYGTVYWKIDRK